MAQRVKSSRQQKPVKTQKKNETQSSPLKDFPLMKKDIQNLSSNVDAIKKEIPMIKKDIQNLSKRLDTYQEQNDAQHKGFDQRMDRLEKKMDDVKAEVINQVTNQLMNHMDLLYENLKHDFIGVQNDRIQDHEARITFIEVKSGIRTA